MRATRIVGGLSVLVLFGAIAWDLANDGFWSRHALFTSLVGGLIVVGLTAAVLNEVLERRQRERETSSPLLLHSAAVCHSGLAGVPERDRGASP